MSGFEWCSLVPLVAGLLLQAYLVFFYLVIIQWLFLASFVGMMNMVALHILFGSLMYNYLSAVTSPPGYVPKNWKPASVEKTKFLKRGLEVDEEIHSRETDIQDDEETASAPPTSPSKNSGKRKTFDEILNEDSADEWESLTTVRYCKRCTAYKPPRAHHCSECDKCVLRMDHHCPWVNNCVGYHNHKYFLLFLNYLILCGVYMAILFIIRVIVLISGGQFDKDPFVPIQMMVICIELLIIIPTVLSVGCLCVYQMSLLVENTTTVESFEKEMYERKAVKKGKIFQHPYNRGTCSNMKDILGTRLLWWPLPSAPEGDGFSYKTIKSIDV